MSRTESKEPVERPVPRFEPLGSGHQSRWATIANEPLSRCRRRVGAAALDLGFHRHERPFGAKVLGRISPAMRLALSESSEPLYLVYRWILQELTQLQQDRLLVVPSPILSRIYSHLEQGFLGYTLALAYARVPFPFVFMQTLEACLLVFTVLMPLYAVAFTGPHGLACFFAALVITVLCGLNELAVEMENPIGNEPNQLPIVIMHDGFVDFLEDTLWADLPQDDPSS